MDWVIVLYGNISDQFRARCCRSGVVTVTERDVARVQYFSFLHRHRCEILPQSIFTFNMQPTDILDFSSQNDYDYLGHLEDEILTRLDCTLQPSLQHQGDDFDDYMNQLCGYMLPKCTRASLTIHSNIFSFTSSTLWCFVHPQRNFQVP